MNDQGTVQAVSAAVRPFIAACQLLILRRERTSVLVHERKYTKLPPRIAIPLLCKHVKGRLRCPPELTILLIHNYEQEPIMQQSLRYAGINNYVALKPTSEDPWRNTLKLTELNTYLASDACQTEYVLYCDSDDVIIRDDSSKTIECLQQHDCQMLLSCTRAISPYDQMPEIQAWTDALAAQVGAEGLYLNAGVYIARTAFLKELVARALDYVTEHDLSREEYRKFQAAKRLGEVLPKFPKGIGSDQAILRYLHPEFYPRMKIDYQSRLATR